MDKIKKQIALWELSDKAQLERFLENYQFRHIMVGFNTYEIQDGYISEDNSAPYIALVNINTKVVKFVHLSLIDNGYVNHSAIDDDKRRELYNELGINPDEVKLE